MSERDSLLALSDAARRIKYVLASMNLNRELLLKAAVSLINARKRHIRMQMRFAMNQRDFKATRAHRHIRALFLARSH